MTITTAERAAAALNAKRDMEILALVDRLTGAVEQVAGSIETMSQIVKILEARITKLEGK